MGKREIFGKIKEIIKDRLEIGEVSITLEMNLEDDLNIDSLDLVEISMGLEETFNLEIPDGEEKFFTVKQIVEYIETRLRDEGIWDKGIEKEPKPCISIPFNGGQILIHEEDSHTAIEIHAAPGWRMAGFSDPIKVGEGKGQGNTDRQMRIFLHYSEARLKRDKWMVKSQGTKRIKKSGV